jgi:hypothetical protein
MDAVYSGAALVAVSNLMRERLRGAMTTGIVPESDRWATPATSTTPTDAPTARGTLLSRVWRFAAGHATRPKVANGSSC